MNNPVAFISVLFAASLICGVLPRKARPFFALAASIFSLIGSFELFRLNPIEWAVMGYPSVFRVDNLSAFVQLFISVFGLLIVVYSIGFMKDKAELKNYYPYVLATIAASIATVISNHLVLFLSFWGFLGITLYLMISLGGEKAKGPAKKTFIIIGGTDALMLLGIAIIWKLTATLRMDSVRLALDSSAAAYAFVLLALGAFAKAGAMPMHTWIPDSAESAPLPVMAFLPASLDKLLGIYLLARLSLDMFVVTSGSSISYFLLAVGAVTIVAGSMMALVQNNMKRLLSYCAVSQVGYIVLGIGTANPVGIAGGLFHMLNHAIYKCTLFLSAGAVEKEAGTTDLDKLGGIAHMMPVTFLSCLVGALAVSGIPPFNGFVSKWMVYQGIVDIGNTGNRLWVIWLIAAMFGSALTLAGFMKLLHAVFLGQKGTGARKDIRETGAVMWIPMAILAVLCIVFGIFAFALPIRYFIAPVLGGKLPYIGIWQPVPATILMFAGLALGAVLYMIGNIKQARVAEPFIGGEVLPAEERPRGTEFYNTITDIPVLGRIYSAARKGLFDIYEIGRRLTFGFSGVLQYLHNGVLPTYLVWCLIGMLILFIVFLRLAI